LTQARSVKTLIIGGGLSGLALANLLEGNARDYLLVEARDRFGGRIKTESVGPGYFDMGPAWFWDGQPRMARLVTSLDLAVFEQYADGILIHEDAHGQVHRGRGFASMQGSYRVQGGLAALTDGLARNLPDLRKQTNALVTALLKEADKIVAVLASGARVQAENVVLALPPRLAAQIAYTPALADQTRQVMQNVPTWMAGQAKAVAVYDTPFWREQGLSGDASSRFGPMVEVHDASPAEGGPFALFGFIGVPPQARGDEDALRAQLLAQLGRLFGPQAAAPMQLFVKDWARDPFTATQADQAPLHAHPTYGMPRALAGLWDGRLHFAGTEVAPQFGGYLEGALEAADTVFAALTTEGGSV